MPKPRKRHPDDSRGGPSASTMEEAQLEGASVPPPVRARRTQPGRYREWWGRTVGVPRGWIRNILEGLRGKQGWQFFVKALAFGVTAYGVMITVLAFKTQARNSEADA